MSSRRTNAYNRIIRDGIYNNTKNTSVLKAPHYSTLGTVGNNPGMEGNVLLDRSTQQLCYHNGVEWIQLSAIPSTAYTDSNAVTDPLSGNPTWFSRGYVQKIGSVGHLTMRAVRTLPILAQNSWVATLPSGFEPTQNLSKVPINTDLGQTGTVDVNTNGRVENISIGMDGGQSEYFDLHILLPL